MFTQLQQHGWNSEGMVKLLADLLNINGDITADVAVPNEIYSALADYDTAWYFQSPEKISGNLRTINGDDQDNYSINAFYPSGGRKRLC